MEKELKKLIQQSISAKTDYYKLIQNTPQNKYIDNPNVRCFDKSMQFFNLLIKKGKNDFN